MNDFNKPFSRINTSCIKWDYQIEQFGKDNLIPFWIADSDYQTAPPIIESLVERCKHGAFGYSFLDHEYKDIIRNYVLRKYHYLVSSDAIITTPTVLTSLYYVISTLTSQNATIVIQTPVYNPFYNVIENNNRLIRQNKLINNDGIYTIDFEDLETAFQNNAKMLIFCNPHNPVGRVWTKEEVKRVVDLCKKYHVILVSDEIHCDLVYQNREFISAGRFFDDYDQILIVTSVSKTFNLAGLYISNIFIPNQKLRFPVIKVLKEHSIASSNILAVTALKAAYTKCDEWLSQQLNHLYNNALYLNDFFKKYLPKAIVAPLEGTYLMWIDLRYLNLSSEEIGKKLVEKGVGINEGAIYGEDYDGFIRINIACSLQQLQQGLCKLEECINNL